MSPTPQIRKGPDGRATGGLTGAQEHRYHYTYTLGRRLSPNSLRLILPSDVTKCRITSALGLGTEEAETVWPKAAFFVSNLIEREVQNASDDRQPGVPVNAQLWQGILGPRYSKRIKDGLAAAGIIERTAEKDQGGHKSERYELGAAFKGQRLRWELVTSTALAARQRNRHRTIRALSRRLHGGRRIVAENLRHVSVSPRLLAMLENPQGLSFAQQARTMLAVQAIEDRRLWLSYPAAGDRFYHSIANAPRCARKHLLIAGDESCEADMSCAQPFLCLTLYPSGEEKERQRFADAVSSGGLYERLRDALPDGDREAMVAHWDSGGRDTLKHEVCESILYAGMTYPLPPIFIAFARLFPVLADILKVHRKTKAGANALAAKMRCLEAGLVYNRVIPRIHAEIPGCVPVSIHDAVMCQRRFGTDVARIFGDEAEQVFGVRPRVSVKGATQ